VDSDPILRFDPATIQRSRADLIHTYSQKLIRYSELFPPDEYMHGYKNLFFD
jgi:acyl-CoA oxidase